MANGSRIFLELDKEKLNSSFNIISDLVRDDWKQRETLVGEKEELSYYASFVCHKNGKTLK